MQYQTRNNKPSKTPTIFGSHGFCKVGRSKVIIILIICIWSGKRYFSQSEIGNFSAIKHNDSSPFLYPNLQVQRPYKRRASRNINIFLSAIEKIDPQWPRLHGHTNKIELNKNIIYDNAELKRCITSHTYLTITNIL